MFETYGITVDDEFSQLNIYYQNENSILSFCQSIKLIDVLGIGEDELINKLDIQDFANILDKPKNRDMLDEIYNDTYEWINDNAWEIAKSTDISKMYYSDNTLKDVLINSYIPKEKQVDLFNLIKDGKSDYEISEEIPEYEEEKTRIKSDLYLYEEESNYFKDSIYKTLKNIDSNYDKGIIKYYLSDWYLRNHRNSAFHNFDIYKEVGSDYLCKIFIEDSRTYNNYQIGKDVVIFYS